MRIMNTRSLTRRRKAGVSEIVATVLMIAVVVALGAVMLTFASNGFGSFGSSFSALITGQGNRLAEQIVVEEVTFNTTGTLGANLYIRNVGEISASIAAIYVQNAFNGTLILSSQLSPNLQINPGSFQNVAVEFNASHGVPYTFTVATASGNTVSINEKA